MRLAPLNTKEDTNSDANEADTTMLFPDGNMAGETRTRITISYPKTYMTRIKNIPIPIQKSLSLFSELE